MKKALVLLVALASVVLFVTSCFSTQIGFTAAPAQEQILPGKEYKVIGRITVEFEDNYGYTLLLEEARKKFPDCDDIVNVFVDYRNDDEAVMSALVIQYMEPVNHIPIYEK